MDEHIVCSIRVLDTNNIKINWRGHDFRLSRPTSSGSWAIIGGHPTLGVAGPLHGSAPWQEALARALNRLEMVLG